jgi:hypothetical protein
MRSNPFGKVLLQRKAQSSSGHWLGKDGQTQERILDVAVSGDRKIDADGRSKTPVGNTVDVANATWTNTIGAGEMITVWKDPDFDPALRAFYHVRVIDRDSRQVADALSRADAALDATALGDPFLLGEEFRAVSQNQVASVFGDGFAKRIWVMEQGRWQGPISSSFGLHFVYISERIPGSLPPLDAVRQAVRREWSNARRLEAEQTLYGSLRERYEIVVEAPPPGNSAQVETSR